VLAELLAENLVSAVSLDLKAPLEGIPHHRTSGWRGDPALVGRSLDLLLATDLPLQVRTTVHPALLSPEEVERLSMDLGKRVARLRSLGAPEIRFDLQRCRTEEMLDPELASLPGLGPEEFAAWQDCARDAYRRGAAAGGRVAAVS
jgi:pyruvate formate lyase activating enzyme